MSNGAADGFERYYAEKLWQLVPEVYRNEDASGAFRQLMELIAAEVAESRRSIDRLWEDQHIETSDDWAVPYIGALVKTRLVSAQDRRARRVDVGNTIRFRRRRGTPDLLDTLARTLSGWDVVLQEGFRRLARTRHRLEPSPRARGIYTATYEGGFADLRNPVGAEIQDSPFDEYFHTLDVRLLRGRDGRHGIRKLNFHLYRLRAFEVIDVDPVELTDPDGLGFLRTFTIDPSGRDTPLFLNGDAGAIEDKTRITRENPICVDPFEWQVTQAIRCRMLGHDAYRITTSVILELQNLPNPPLPSDLVALARIRGARFDSESALRRQLTDFGAAIGAVPADWYVELVGLSLMVDTGKAQLYPSQVAISDGVVDFVTERISAGNLSDLLRHPEIAGGLAELVISPEHGRFASLPPGEPVDFEPSVARYHYGFSAELGAGPYPRSDINIVPDREASDGVVPDGGELQGDGLRIVDNRSYELTIEAGQPLLDDAAITVGPQRRPFVLLRGAAGSETEAVLQPGDTNQTFIIDGGWYAGQDPNGELADGDTFDLVINGAAGNTDNEYDFERVEIRFSTLDPGGVRADGVRIPPLRIFVRSRIRRLVLRRAITGPIVVEKEDSDDPSLIEELLICESIVDGSQTSDGIAISNMFGRVVLEGSTVFGNLNAAMLDASNSVVDGVINVVNNQDGCFRFSATVDAPGVRLPPRYRDYVGRIPPAFFNSSRFGDPQYAQLSLVAPEAITTGAENGSEMGAFSHLLNPIRLNSIRAKVDEYGPAGQLAQYLFEGDRAAESLYMLDALSPEPPPLEPPPPPEAGDPIPIPPPPPPPPLPTRCPDDPDPDPDPQPGPDTTDIVVITLADADLNGAPQFWRSVDWLPAPNAAIDPTAAVLPGIPLDKVDYVVEYDARLGSVPEDQDWQSSPAAPGFFHLKQGTLAFGNATDEPAFYTRSVVLERGIPEQVHAYATVLINNAPRRARRDPGESFEIKFLLADGGNESRGMRAGWSRNRNTGLFRYVTLDSTDRFAPTSIEPHDRLVHSWMSVSLQADLSDNRALMSLAGIVDHRSLEWFGRADAGGEAALTALFGFTRRRGRASGQVRNVVVSGPGRFIRIWLRSVAPVDAPVLRLGFITDDRRRGRARISVRYDGDPDRQPFALPGVRINRTLRIGGVAPGQVSFIDLPLARARQGQHLLLTVERDWTHRGDQLRATARLVSARLLVPGDN